MNDSTHKVPPVPEDRRTVTPFVIVKGASRFIEFLETAFNALEITRMTGEDGLIGHAEVWIGDSVVMMFDSKEEWPVTPAFLRLYVEDCDETYMQALQAGAAVVTEPTDMPWGDRICRVRDPFGNLWWIMTRRENVRPEEEARRYGDQTYLDALQYVQNADFFPGRH